MEPRASVILPIKNINKDIVQVLDSIYGQSVKELELLVVVPSTSNLLNDLQKKYKFNVIVCDKGKNASVNFGSNAARGRYILFIDDDMILEEDVLEKCLNLAETKNIKSVIIPEKVLPKKGLLNKVALLEKKMAFLDPQIESPRFFEKNLYCDLGGINEDLDPIDEGDLKAKLEENGEISFKIDSYISILPNNRIFSLKKRMSHMYMRGKKFPLFKELHPQSNQLKFTKRGKQYFINYKYFLLNPLAFLTLATLKIGDYIFMKVGSMNLSRADKKLLSDIKNKRIFENEAGIYQKEFFENTKGAQYVDNKEKSIVYGYMKGFNPKEKIKILDIGPGGGRWSNLMLGFFSNAEVVGCDLSKGMVKDLNDKFINEHRFKAVVGDMQNLPFNDNEFDLVISIRAVKYAQDQKKVFEEISRVLKLNSYAIIELPYLNIIYRLIKSLKIFGKLSEYANRINLIKKSRIIRNAKSVGFRVLDSDVHFTVPATFYKNTNNLFILKVLNIIDFILPKKIFGRSLFLKFKNINDRFNLNNNC